MVLEKDREKSVGPIVREMKKFAKSQRGDPFITFNKKNEG